MQDLNSYLEDKVYLAGNQFTLADTLMYYGIHHIIVSLASNNQTEPTSELNLKGVLSNGAHN